MQDRRWWSHGGDKTGWNLGWPGMGEPIRMVKGLGSEVWVRESQGVPRAQEAPFDPIPLRGRHEVALFLVRSSWFSRDPCGLLLVKTRFVHGDSARSSFSFTYSYSACETFAISLMRGFLLRRLGHVSVNSLIIKEN